MNKEVNQEEDNQSKFFFLAVVRVQLMTKDNKPATFTRNVLADSNEIDITVKDLSMIQQNAVQPLMEELDIPLDNVHDVTFLNIIPLAHTTKEAFFADAEEVTS